MALARVKVLELAGLAPAPYCGMILADFGADVVRIDRPNALQLDKLSRGKRSIELNLKSPNGISVLKRMCQKADVIIEPFRPGVMEKMGIGPEVLCKENDRLIYARMTGFGQKGPYKHMAGHDINYISISGALSICGRAGEAPFPPVNLLADFAGGGMVCAMGIMAALIERSTSGKGQVIDSSMVDGSAYVSSFIYATKNMFFTGPRGTNLLDSGAPFYDTYQTKDGKYMAVGALEPQFFAKFMEGLGVNKETPGFQRQMDQESWPLMRSAIKDAFKSKTRDEWQEIFNGKDACVTPVLEMDEVADHPHNKEREMITNSDGGNLPLPAPAPRLSRTPASPSSLPLPQPGQHTKEILKEYGIPLDDFLPSSSL